MFLGKYSGRNHVLSRAFAKRFYKSKSWKATRQAYFESQNGLCERCRRLGRFRPGEIVHHKVHLSPANINDPNITLSPLNLELLCRDCHAMMHPEIYGGSPSEQRVAFDENGNVVKLEVSHGQAGDGGQAEVG